MHYKATRNRFSSVHSMQENICTRCSKSNQTEVQLKENNEVTLTKVPVTQSNFKQTRTHLFIQQSMCTLDPKFKLDLKDEFLRLYTFIQDFLKQIDMKINGTYSIFNHLSTSSLCK